MVGDAEGTIGPASPKPQAQFSASQLRHEPARTSKYAHPVGGGYDFVDQFGLQIAFAAAAPKKGGWRQPGMWTWKAKFYKPPSLVSVPAMASFIMANESSACTLDRSGLAILLGATQTARKLVCATQCHSNGHEWPRSDLF